MWANVLRDVCKSEESNLNFVLQPQGKNDINIQVHVAKAVSFLSLEFGHVHV